MPLQNPETKQTQPQEAPKVETAEAKPEQRAERGNEGKDNVIHAAERFVAKEMRDLKAAEHRFQEASSNVEFSQKASREKYPTVIAEKFSAAWLKNKAAETITGTAFEAKKSNRELQDVQKFVELSPQFQGKDKAALEAERTELLAELKNLQGRERDVNAERLYNQVNKKLDTIEAYTHGLATVERKMKSEALDASPVVEADRDAA